MTDSVPKWHRFNSGASGPLDIVGKVWYEVHLVFLERSLVISIMSGIDGRAVSAWILFMAGMSQTCRAAPWLTTLLSDTNVWTTWVLRYSSSIFSFIMPPYFLKEDDPAVSSWSKVMLLLGYKCIVCAKWLTSAWSFIAFNLVIFTRTVSTRTADQSYPVGWPSVHFFYRIRCFPLLENIAVQLSIDFCRVLNKQHHQSRVSFTFLHELPDRTFFLGFFLSSFFLSFGFSVNRNTIYMDLCTNLSS